MKNELTEQVVDALNSIFDAINKYGSDKEVEEGLRNVLALQHRTLQQNFMRLVIVPSIKIFAEKKANNNTDLRNEAACDLATKLLPIVENEPLPFI